jgi:hypothetical protein
MMTMLSTTAWVAHDLGLASAFGGNLFGKLALEPAVGEVSNPEERDRVEDRAWRRFSIWNAVALGTYAVTWFAGRKILTGREVSRAARALTITKDALVGSSVGVGLGAMIVGRLLSRAKQEHVEPARVRKIHRAVNVLGDVQLGLTAAILGVTSALAMQAGRSTKFSAVSRFLP